MEPVGPVTIVKEVQGDVINNCSYNISRSVSQPDANGIHFRVEKPEINFIGRSMELYELEQFSSATNPPTIVASGMGGIGKTQLVRKFIDENQSKYGNVIWVDSENDENIINSFKQLSEDILHLSTRNANGNEKDSKSVIEQVLKKLCRRKTLFVYDNVESTKSINFVLAMAPPLGEHPHVIVTSRLQEWADGIRVIQLKVWNMAESISYISKMLRDSENDSKNDKICLAEMLQHFPLALRQATALINHQRGRDDFEISEYIDKYNRNTREMLHSAIFQGHSTSPYRKTTYTTWSITIDAIQGDNLHGQLAIKIFKIIAYFAADDIKRDFFLHLTDGEVDQRTDYEERLKSAVDLLVKYCMVDSQNKQRILSIHRLVQDVTKFKLKESHEEEAIMRHALELITKLISETKPHKFHLHAISVFLSALTIPDLVKEFGSLAVTILKQLINLDNCDQAEGFGEEIVRPLINILGQNDRVLLKIQYYIAKIHLKNCMFDQALQMSIEIFEKQKFNFSEQDCDTLKTQTQVADSYEELGDDNEALKWYENVFQKQKINLGENHPDTLKTMCKTAFTLKEMGRANAALLLYKQVFGKLETSINGLLVVANVVYLIKKIGDRSVKLKTHADFLDYLTGWGGGMTVGPRPTRPRSKSCSGSEIRG